MMKFLSWIHLGLWIFSPLPLHAWGPLGHRMVTETAVQLLEKTDPLSVQGNGNWGMFLARHRFELGYYSIIPDSHFRAEDGMKGKLESPTHFFDMDVALKSISHEAIKQVPHLFSDYSAWVKPNLPSSVVTVEEIGTAPWRIEQLMALAAETLKDVKDGKGTYQEGKRSSGDAKKIFDSLQYIGILTHYTADMSMPHHASEDWNSFSKGHGGIHFYFENDCVDELEPGLSEAALKLALNRAPVWLKQWKADTLPPGKVVMEALLQSYAAIDAVLKVDRAHAVTELAEKSPTKKSGKNAKRKPARMACEKFKPLLIEQIAKGATLTSLMIKWVLPKNVDFSSPAPLKFFDFEIKPDYIEPKYEKFDILKSLPNPNLSDWSTGKKKS